MMHHGRDVSNYELIEWINELSKLQVGEIIINSIVEKELKLLRFSKL